MIGKDVEIIVMEEATSASTPGDLSLLDAAAGKDLIDPAALKELRDASLI